MQYIFMILPIVFLIGSVVWAILAVKRGTKTKTAVVSQMMSFFVICIICTAAPMIANAQSTNDVQDTTTASQSAEASSDGLGLGLSMIAAALVTGLAGIGGGIAVAAAAPAAIGATSEDPKSFGKALIFVALGEGIALYGLLVSILILNKI